MGKKKKGKSNIEKELTIRLIISIISLITALIGLIDRLIRILE